MNKIIFLTFVLVGATIVKAQEPKNVTWLTNIEEAQKIAKEKNKKVFVYFSGSDWCKPCKELKNEVLSSEEFKKKALLEYVLVNIDFPRNRRKLTKERISYIEESAEKYNNLGAFPFVAILSNKALVINTVDGYKSETATYYIENYL
ncbi:thioredoxin family protein [Tenacibaculum ovolyticum]|uniref:thioredoxin family protein n=1 Tax=Tenacibaculum ovolyticum TaxID=104270 RepID=UPI0007ECAB69|nr:thioredoxin family protein [Tenacibaculum ovolyticum]